MSLADSTGLGRLGLLTTKLAQHEPRRTPDHMAEHRRRERRRHGIRSFRNKLDQTVQQRGDRLVIRAFALSLDFSYKPLAFG